MREKHRRGRCCKMSEFRHHFTVYYEDTDEGGVVYHANYLKYAERARSEWLKSLGFSNRQLWQDHGLRIVVRRQNIAYRAPARMEDELVATAQCTSPGRASIRLEQKILRGADVLVDMQVDLAVINGEGRPTPLPREIKERIHND